MLDTIGDFFKNLFSPAPSETELPEAPDLDVFVEGVDDVDQPEIVEDEDTEAVVEEVPEQTPEPIPYEEDDDGFFEEDQTPGEEANVQG